MCVIIAYLSEVKILQPCGKGGWEGRERAVRGIGGGEGVKVKRGRNRWWVLRREVGEGGRAEKGKGKGKRRRKVEGM